MCKLASTAAFSLMLILLTSVAGAQNQAQPDAQEMLKKVEETYRKLKSYQLEYRLKTERTQEGDGLKSTYSNEEAGKISVSKPGKTNVEWRSTANKQIAVSDGITTWIYEPNNKIYVARNAAEFAIFSGDWNRTEFWARNVKEAIQKVERLARITSESKGAKSLGDEFIDLPKQRVKCLVVEIDTSKSEKQIYKRRLWVDPRSYLVLRESRYTKEIGRFSTTEITVTTDFIDFRVNEPIDDNFFVFTPSAGSMKVDSLDPNRLAAGPAPRGPVKWAGQTAPDFTLKDMNGKEVSLQSLRGKVVLLNFWATWCGPCRVEMPQIEKISREYQKKGLVVLGIDDEEAEVASAFLKKNGYTFNSLVDEGRTISGLYQISAIPQSFFITKDGRIAMHYRGTRSETEIRAGVERAFSGLIAAAEPEIKPSGPPANKSVPKLGTPQSGAILANGRGDRQVDYSWEFDWSDCPGATQYHLYVIGANAQNPVINDDTITASSYSKFFRGSYVVDHHLKGWTWKVRAKIGGVWGEWSELHSFDVEPMGTMTVMMPAPKLTEPAHQIVYDHYPRATTLGWEPVPGAASYRVEIEAYDRGSRIWFKLLKTDVTTTSHSFQFVGAQPGRWRVRAIDANGRIGTTSEWREFRYTR